MAEHGILKINPAMVDPDRRSAVSMGSAICAIAYNRNQLAADKVPNKWEDFLKPEFKGRKFLVDVRPLCLAALVPLMGEEWVMNYARKIKEQEPIWVRGQTRAISGIIAGEYALHQMSTSLFPARKTVSLDNLLLIAFYLGHMLPIDD